MKTTFRSLASLAVLSLASTSPVQAQSNFDKKGFMRHAGASAVIGCVTEYYTQSRAWAYGLTFAAGAAYELRGKLHPEISTYQTQDLRDNAIGMVAGIEGCRAVRLAREKNDEPGRLKLTTEADADPRFSFAVVPTPGRGVVGFVHLRF